MEEHRRMRCVVRMDTWFASILDRCVNIFLTDCPFVSLLVGTIPVYTFLSFRSIVTTTIMLFSGILLHPMASCMS